MSPRLPSEWRAAKLREVARSLQTGPFGSQLKAEQYDPYGQVAVVMPKELTEDGIAFDESSKINEDVLATVSRHRLAHGDILFSRRGDVRRVGIYLSGSPPAVCGTGCLRARLGDQLLPMFARLMLSSTTVGDWLEDHAVGQTMPNLNTTIIGDLPIILPPLDEQRRIAAVLKTWDDAIATAERLHACLLRAKLGMEGTLVGDGEVTMLSDMADVAFSSVDKRVTAGEQPVRLCNYMDVLRHRRLQDSIEFSAGTATQSECRRFSLRRDDVVFTKDSETAREVAEASYVADDVANVVCGYHLAIARPKPGFSGAYLSHAMRVPRLRQQFVIRANGAIRFGLTLDAIQQIRLPAPTLERQLAIAAALDHAEDEAERYEAMVGLLRRQKRGLMQKLLTGEWRVPATGDAFVPGGPAADRLEAAE